jgi:hypothetical protein
MAFPYIFESNFEGGSNGEWDSQTDTSSLLTFPRYDELVRFPGRQTPFNGAYCAKWTLTSSTNDAYVVEGDINQADDETRWFRFNILFGSDFAATAEDEIALFETISAGATSEAAVSCKITATSGTTLGDITLGISKVSASSTSYGGVLERNVWYTVEVKHLLDTGGAGTIDIYVSKDGDAQATAVYATQVATVTNVAVTTGHLGVKDKLATTTGTILIDNFVMDDTQVYAPVRFPETRLFTKSGHAFVGNGTVENVQLLGGTNDDNRCTLWDTDSADTNDVNRMVTELKNTTATETVETDTPRRFSRGCYVELAGQQPRALLKLGRVPGYSEAGIRDHGLRR